MSMDITPTLIRQAVQETMADTGKSLEEIATDVGYHEMTLRVWLNRAQTFAPKIEQAVARWLSHVYVPTVPAIATKRCPRCRETFARSVMASNGYCKPCNTEKSRESSLRRKGNV